LAGASRLERCCRCGRVHPPMGLVGLAPDGCTCPPARPEESHSTPAWRPSGMPLRWDGRPAPSRTVGCQAGLTSFARNLQYRDGGSVEQGAVLAAARSRLTANWTKIPRLRDRSNASAIEWPQAARPGYCRWWCSMPRRGWVESVRADGSSAAGVSGGCAGIAVPTLSGCYPDVGQAQHQARA
jgi:hypothetical protein